jgi:hypothetical protein
MNEYAIRLLSETGTIYFEVSAHCEDEALDIATENAEDYLNFTIEQIS